MRLTADFFTQLTARNPLLFTFGLACFALAGICLALVWMRPLEVAGANAWFKPIKFALSIGIYSWTMGWLLYDLDSPADTVAMQWAIVWLLGLELLYITVQAARGQGSHFNLSTPFYAGMYAFMAIAAAAISFWTGYIGLLFFVKPLPQLPDHYLWAIRIGLMLFLVFSLEGFVMGSRLSHTIGGRSHAGLPFLTWSTRFGDPRVAHFIGMHALQVLPLLSFFFLKNVKTTFLAGAMYALLAVWVLVQALQGKPFIRM